MKEKERGARDDEKGSINEVEKAETQTRWWTKDKDKNRYLSRRHEKVWR